MDRGRRGAAEALAARRERARPGAARAARKKGVRRRAAHGPGGLTRREVEVLELVSSGMTNRAVARTLWVTSETVKFHLSNVYRKLGVSNRVEASQWARENGISNVAARDPRNGYPGDLRSLVNPG